MTSHKVERSALHGMLWSALEHEKHDDWCHAKPDVCGTCSCSCSLDRRVADRVLSYLAELHDEGGAPAGYEPDLDLHRARFIERRAAVLAGAEAYDAPGVNRAYWRTQAKASLIADGRLP